MCVSSAVPARVCVCVCMCLPMLPNVSVLKCWVRFQARGFILVPPSHPLVGVVNPCVGGAVKNNNVHVYVYLDIFSRAAPFLVFLHVAKSRMFPLQNARYLANNYGRLG